MGSQSIFFWWDSPFRGVFYPEGQALRGAFYPAGQFLRLTSPITISHCSLQDPRYFVTDHFAMPHHTREIIPTSQIFVKWQNALRPLVKHNTSKTAV